jgi:hypothetical protein
MSRHITMPSKIMIDKIIKKNDIQDATVLLNSTLTLQLYETKDIDIKNVTVLLDSTPTSYLHEKKDINSSVFSSPPLSPQPTIQ